MPRTPGKWTRSEANGGETRPTFPKRSLPDGIDVDPPAILGVYHVVELAAVHRSVRDPGRRSSLSSTDKNKNKKTKKKQNKRTKGHPSAAREKPLSSMSELQIRSIAHRPTRLRRSITPRGSEGEHLTATYATGKTQVETRGPPSSQTSRAGVRRNGVKPCLKATTSRHRKHRAEMPYPRRIPASRLPPWSPGIWHGAQPAAAETTK